MAPVGFEPTISAGERPHTYALDRAATETGTQAVRRMKYGPHLLLYVFFMTFLLAYLFDGGMSFLGS